MQPSTSQVVKAPLLAVHNLNNDILKVFRSEIQISNQLLFRVLPQFILVIYRH